MGMTGQDRQDLQLKLDAVEQQLVNAKYTSGPASANAYDMAFRLLVDAVKLIAAKVP